MRKIVFILTLVMSSFIIASCSDDDNDKSKAIDFSEIPAVSQEFIKNHFGNEGAFDESEIRRVEVESNGEYEVLFVNGIEVDFYANGVWKEIDLNGKQLPNSIAMLLPSNALSYIGTKYPSSQIEELEKQGAYSENQSFKVELRGDRDIYFDYLGNVLKDKGQVVDDKENISQDALPEVSKAFLLEYFGNVTATPRVEKEWDKYEVTYYEDSKNEINIEFFLDGTFKDIELETENNVIRTIMTNISKSDNLVKYVDTNYAGYFIEEFSVIKTNILGPELNGGYRVDVELGRDEWKIYFKADGSFFKKVND